jgi:hypothetical protein
MNFLRKSVFTPLTNVQSTIAGPEAFASNPAYGRGFFEPNGFAVALKRCESGHDLAQQLADVFIERAQIESNYALQLRSWSQKHQDKLAKSQEYGTNKSVWEQSLTTGRRPAV